MKRSDIDKQKESIILDLESGKTRTEICRELGCKYDTLLSRLKEWDVLHLKNPGRRGTEKHYCRVHVAKHLRKGSTINSYKLKNLLFRDKLKERKCEECDTVIWRGKPVPLELHHVNGDRFDNRIENLQILCSNCHSQTDNNSGKNVGTYSKTFD
jgi:hypothetical protein